MNLKEEDNNYLIKSTEIIYLVYGINGKDKVLKGAYKSDKNAKRSFNILKEKQEYETCEIEKVLILD